MGIDVAALAGLLLVLAAYVSYLVMLFVLHRFTYRTWLFHVTVIAGMLLALAGLLAGGSREIGLAALALGGAWFLVTRLELGLVGSRAMRVHVGDPMPAFTALDIAGRTMTERDLVASAPALLVLYRGWWCPSSKVQLDEMRRHYADLAALGVTIFAGSVDGPDESAPMQDHVGDTIRILCSVQESFLDEIGVRDRRGAPWYDRLWFGAMQRAIAMPAAIAIDRTGRIVFAERSTRVDERPQPKALIASLTSSIDRSTT